jgi:hypothetical protein
MKREVGGPVFLPAVVPRGYVFAHWTLEALLGEPTAGEDWYSITFQKGAKTLKWSVAIQDGTCGQFSNGGSDGIYWSNPGPDGQDAWRCVRSTRALVIDAFDHRPTPLLPLARLASMLRSAYRA